MAKVFIGLSGGVDSSTSAAVLKRQGFDVVGVFIKVWQPDFLPCTWREDRQDAMRVAAYLDIPFITMDLEKEYKEGIVDYMVCEYKEGRTPNPDVMCNKEIKFGAFFKRAMEMGADYVAMGHYARIQTVQGPTLDYLDYPRSDLGQVELLKGVDENKDQSYFLWTLGQEELSKTLFPIGEYQKSEVRKMAEKFGLPTAQKKDSQGLCFMGMLDMKEFLKEFIPEKKGSVLNEKGEVVGEHDGAHFYTIGQRHGLSITQKSTEKEPYYIVSKDITKNTLTVAHKTEMKQAGGRRIVTLHDANWIGEKPKENINYKARVRYRGELLPCTVKVLNEARAEVTFNENHIAPIGQSLVLYDGERCLGGGIID